MAERGEGCPPLQHQQLLQACVQVQINAPDTAARNADELRSQPLVRSQRRRRYGVPPGAERDAVAAGLARPHLRLDLAVAPELEHKPLCGSLTRVVVADGRRRAAHNDAAQPRGVSGVSSPRKRRGQRKHRGPKHERAHGGAV